MTPHALATLLDAAHPAASGTDAAGPADPALAAALARLPTPIRRDLLGTRRLPEALLAWAFAYASPDELLALADNPHIGPDALTRLADTGDPALHTPLYRNRHATDALRRRLLATHPLPDTLRALLLGTSSRRLLGPALDCPHPALAAHARAHVTGPRNRRPANTPQALYDWFHGTARRSPKARGLLRGRRALFDLGAWSDADWAGLVVLHNRSPLDNPSRRVLLETPECPRAVALALLRTDSPDNAETDDASDDSTGSVLAAGLARGAFRPSDVIHHAPYAAHVLRALESLERDADHNPEPPVATALRDELTTLVRRTLGSRPRPWRAVLAHLSASDFPGTLPALCAAALTGPEPEYRRRPWPHEQQVSWSPFTHLLRCAEPAALPGILGALHPHDLGELAHYDTGKPLPDALVDAFLDHASPESADVFLTHHAHHDATRTRLLIRDDPALNAALLRRADVPSRTWYAVAAGIPHGPDRTSPVPLHPETRAALRGGVRANRRADVVRHAVHTGDAELIVAALRHPQPALTTAHQITGCRRLAALGRADALAELAGRHGPLDPLLATRIRTALGVHPTDAATPAGTGAAETTHTPAAVPPERLRALRLQLRALDRAQCLHDLRHGSLDAIRGQLERDEPPPWDAVSALLAAGELTERARDLLAERPDCPEAVALTLLERDRGNTAVPLALAPRSRALALAALARQPVVPEWSANGPLQPALTWSVSCLRAGTLTPDDLYALGRPAHAVLGLLSALPGELAPIRAAIAADPALRVAHAADMWAVAAALVPEFDGTLPELLATAAAAALPADLPTAGTHPKPAGNLPIGN
ncbi:hypothetical protein LO772_18690 [Yinghuangia sp. ASG 101]|uniref:hypothetical protein n=1 Tax=Yinghuangia sp. ASG 101 TaxID=2896848 RepID=UPI001E4F5DAE|nr:hypothetical protein [Yinghuangia sp. ASG 101]UGQ09002.1 hypothetical protein LO772_18690 [Yinghuangia sp. ASG 101]